jgi:hypothetical protein
MDENERRRGAEKEGERVALVKKESLDGTFRETQNHQTKGGTDSFFFA